MTAILTFWSTFLVIPFNFYYSLMSLILADLQWGNVKCDPAKNSWTTWTSQDMPTATGDWEMLNLDKCKNPGVQVNR